MENAVDALKMAFSVFVLILAIAVAVGSFSMAKTASDVIMHAKDETNFFEYYEDEGVSSESRIVGIETVIPTLYRYYKENYKVEFWKGTSYNSTTGLFGNRVKLNFTTKAGTRNFFDLDYERNTLGEPWTSSNDELKKHLDAFINGKVYKNPATGLNYKDYSMKSFDSDASYFMQACKDKKFLETLRVEKEVIDGTTKDKRVIVYTRIDS